MDQMDRSVACSPPLSRVVVSGGTHGNELAGVCLVKEWLRGDSAPCLERSSFTAQPLLANPRATEQGVRYVNTDLNRCFKTHTLSAPPSPSDPYELVRARELDSLLGPKGSDEAVDFICDLHNTTANMGASLILYSLSDYFCLHMLHHLQTHMQSAPVYCVVFEEPPSAAYSLDTIGKRGLALEVGPLPHGLVRADVLSQMSEGVKLILDFIDLFNRGTLFPPCQVEVYRKLEGLDFPRELQSGELSGTVHPERQDRDFRVLNPGDPLFLRFDGETVRFKGERPVYPFFINEAAYYEKKLALWTAERVSVSVPALRVRG
ncbi:N-acyl-aromatic-L-amino acid amidohydrolase (carboxylate-forming)-like, partial [Acipenser ruthenus]|uniref:N-acyl-aromatic-L-amino acid amidohydrolase (carboxylate-forming)-like n=1 Tax=Acipenser ruthenus TaxID=7906 RepID=UPI002741A9F2